MAPVRRCTHGWLQAQRSNGHAEYANIRAIHDAWHDAWDDAQRANDGRGVSRADDGLHAEHHAALQSASGLWHDARPVWHDVWSSNEPACPRCTTPHVLSGVSGTCATSHATCVSQSDAWIFRKAEQHRRRSRSPVKCKQAAVTLQASLIHFATDVIP